MIVNLCLVTWFIYYANIGALKKSSLRGQWPKMSIGRPAFWISNNAHKYMAIEYAPRVCVAAWRVANYVLNGTSVTAAWDTS